MVKKSREKKKLKAVKRSLISKDDSNVSLGKKTKNRYVLYWLSLLTILLGVSAYWIVGAASNHCPKELLRVGYEYLYIPPEQLTLKDYKGMITNDTALKINDRSVPMEAVTAAGWEVNRIYQERKGPYYKFDIGVYFNKSRSRVDTSIFSTSKGNQDSLFQHEYIHYLISITKIKALKDELEKTYFNEAPTREQILDKLSMAVTAAQNIYESETSHGLNHRVQNLYNRYVQRAYDSLKHRKLCVEW